MSRSEPCSILASAKRYQQMAQWTLEHVRQRLVSLFIYSPVRKFATQNARADARAPATAKERGMPAMDESGPTVKRRVLGAHLRRLREDRLVTREEAARAIGGSESKISRLENGKIPVKVSDVDALLTRYGLITGPEYVALRDMARYSNVPGWWQRYSDVLPAWFHTYVGLESAATQIRTYESQFIPGLLQTEAYSRAITKAGRSRRTSKQIERRVKSRQERQRIMRTKGTVLWAIIDEGALHRRIGGRDVMMEQLEYLIKLIEEESSISIQVLPFSIGIHPAEFGAFSMLRFEEDGPEPDPPDVVYLEQLTGAVYLDKLEEVDQYREVFTQLIMSAQGRPESADTIAKIIAAF